TRVETPVVVSSGVVPSATVASVARNLMLAPDVADVRVGEPEDSQMIGVMLTAFPYVFCAAPGYLAAHGTPARPEDLRQHDCIVNRALTQEGQWRFGRGGETARLAPPARVSVIGDRPAAVFARAGLGVALCMRRAVEADLASGDLVAVLEDWNVYDRKVHALIPHRGLMPAKTRLLVDHLKRHLQ
ncbi:MAG: substrate binding domain-containing protein, partial [Pseudomonadota bacterium]